MKTSKVLKLSDPKVHLTVAVVVERDGHFLMVEEWCNGTAVFNQPAGHVEVSESLLDAAIRECYEETGWYVQPKYVLGVYLLQTDDGGTYHRICFVAEPLFFDDTSTLDNAIIRCEWLSLSFLHTQSQRLRSPLVLQCLNDYMAGVRFDLSMIRTLSLQPLSSIPLSPHQMSLSEP